MRSCRTCVRMIACILIPGFELQVALHDRPRLALEPAALVPDPGVEPLLGPVTAAAEAAGVRPGMRLGEALAMCPSLVLVERDALLVESHWEKILRSSRTAGSRSSRSSPGPSTSTPAASSGSTAASTALTRALTAVGAAWNASAGAADRRFAALAAAAIARPGQAVSSTTARRTSSHRCHSRSCRSRIADGRSSTTSGSRRSDSLRATGQRRRRTTGAGRPARLEPGESGGRCRL